MAGLRFLHLGDSYTCAEGISAAEGWPARLRKKLRDQGLRVRKPRVLATTGWTSGELLEAMQRRRFGADYDIVTLCVGVNDQYRGLELDAYRRNLASIVSWLQPPLRRESGAAVLLSIPDWGASPFAAKRDWPHISGEIDAFNKAAETIARRFGLLFINWTPLTRSFARQRDAFAPDKLHPSGSQYAAWAEFLYESLFRTGSGMLKSSIMR